MCTFTLYAKLKVDLNIRGKTIKLSEESIGVNLNDFGFGSELLDKTLKAWATKERKLDLIKMKIFVLQRTLSKWKDDRMEENVASNFYDKELVSTIYKELL